jgi:hypothetical protein
MPKNENNVDAPSSYVPTAESIANANTASAAPTRTRRLGTGAIIGISAAGVALLAGTFGAGAVVGSAVAHNSRPSIGQMGDMAQGGPKGQQGQMGQEGQMGQQGGQQGQRPQRGQDGGAPNGTAPNGPAPTGAPTAAPKV